MFINPEKRVLAWAKEPVSTKITYKDIKNPFMVKFPKLLFILSGINSLSVFALSESRKKHFVSELITTNISNTKIGRVCLGSAKLRVKPKSFKELIDGYEKLYFESVFSSDYYNSLKHEHKLKEKDALNFWKGIKKSGIIPVSKIKKPLEFSDYE